MTGLTTNLGGAGATAVETPRRSATPRVQGPLGLLGGRIAQLSAIHLVVDAAVLVFVTEGPVERMSATESDELFAERPPSGQATTVASHQGEELGDPDRLRREVEALMQGDESLSRPEDWGGYRLDPDLIEFWHGSPGRLHCRLLYAKTDGCWEHRRVQP